MAPSPVIEKLQNKIFTGKGKTSPTELTNILELAREFGALGEIIGRDFEVCDKEGNLLYLVRQKPITVAQLNTLLKELNVMKMIESESMKQTSMPKKGRRR